MPKSFRFRHANEVAGTFVLSGLALLIAAVVLIGISHGWFTRTVPFTLALPEQGSQGLKEGADVAVLGNVVGSVRRLRVTAEGKMLADVTVQSDFAKFINRDSTAVIHRTLGIGDASVEIKRAGGPPVEPGQTIPVESEAGPTEMIQSTIEKEVVPAVQEARAAFGEYRQLAADLRRPDSPIQQALGRVNAMTVEVQAGHGLAGKLLTDPTLAADVTGTVSRANAALGELQQTIGDVHKTTATVAAQTDETVRRMQTILTDIEKTTAALPETTKSINRTAEALPGLVLQLQETLRQTQRVVEGLQRSFLVRGSIAPDETRSRIRPEDVGAGGR